jgi:MSHA pilin protein MshC
MDFATLARLDKFCLKAFEMYLNTSLMVTNQQVLKYCAKDSSARLSRRIRGFTLVELIMTMVIVGVLAVYAAPRFLGSSVFQSRGFSDQVQASLRYAQKVAIAQNRFVCVNITTNNTLALTLGATNACGTNLQSLSGGANYTIKAPSGITVANANFFFDVIGRPSLAQSIAVAGGGMTTTIIVEAETGYVHL